MFKRRRNLKNAAAGAIPTERPPQKVEIRNHEASLAPVLLVAVFGFIVLAMAVWLALVFLAGRAGFREPDRIVATWIIRLLFGGPLLVLIAVGSGMLVARFFEHRERIETIRGEMLYKQLMARRETVSSRVDSETYRKVQLIEAVMWEAYQHIEDYGQYTANDVKPYSRDVMKEYVLAGETEPVGFKLAQEVNRWLRQRRVVTNKNTVNLNFFPDYGSLQQLVRNQYEVPIQYNGSPPQLREGETYSIIPGIR